VGQLVPAQSWAIGSVHEPPGSREDGSESYVTTNSAVPEQQPVGDQSIVGASWLFVHDVQIRWVEGESGGWKTIGDQVNPKKLDWDQSFWDTEGGGQEDADYLTNVGGDQVSNELFHVVVDGSTFTNGGNNRGKVVVSEDHIGGGFSDSGTGAHGNTDFGFLQSWGIVDTITSHGGDVTVGLQVSDDFRFVGWFDSGKQSSVQASLELLVLVQVIKFSAGVSFTISIFVIVKDTNSSANSDSGVLVVTSDNNNSDTGSVTLFDTVKDFHPWWIQHTDNTQEGQVLFVFNEFSSVNQIHLGIWNWAIVDSQSQAPQSISAGSVFEDQRFDVFFHVSSEFNSFVTDSGFGAPFENGFGGTFDEQFVVATGFFFNKDGHRFSVSGELESVSFFVHSFDLAVYSRAFLAGGETVQVFTENVEFLNQNGQSGFSSLTNLLVNTFSGVEIDSGVVTQSTSRGEFNQIWVVNTFGWAVVGVVEGTFWLVSGARHRVLSDVEFAVGNRLNGEHFADGHLVGGEGTGFIGTDNGSATESFDGWKRPDNGVFLGHSVGTESQTGGDDGWETFWDSSDGEGDSDFEVVNSTFYPGATVHWVVEVSDVDSPNENADDGDHFRQLFTKLVEFFSQWGLFSFGFNHRFSDFTDFGVLTSFDDNTNSFSGSDIGTGEEKIDFILIDGSSVWNGGVVFGNGNRFSGEESLIDFDGGGFDLEDSDISWDLVTNSNINDIAWNEIAGKNLLNLAWSVLSEDFGHGWFVFFQSFNSGFGVLFLPDTDAGVGDQDGQNDQWFDEGTENRVFYTFFLFFKKSEDKRDHGGEKENSDE
jgi:hypothetical protein